MTIDVNSDPELKYGGKKGSRLPLEHPQRNERAVARGSTIFMVIFMTPIVAFAAFSIYKEIRKSMEISRKRSARDREMERRDAAWCKKYPVPLMKFTPGETPRFIHETYRSTIYPVPPSNYWSMVSWPTERHFTMGHSFDCSGEVPVGVEVRNSSGSGGLKKQVESVTRLSPKLARFRTDLKSLCHKEVAALYNENKGPLFLEFSHHDFSPLNLKCLQNLTAPELYVKIHGKINDPLARILVRNSRIRGLFLPSSTYNRVRLTGAGLKILTRLKELRALDLSEAEITEEQLTQLSAFKKLEYLKLEDIPLTKTTIETLSTLPSLKHLLLNDNGLSNADFAGIVRLKNLESIQVGCRRQESCHIDDALFLLFAQLPKLKEVITTTYFYITDKALSNLSTSKSLRRLVIGNGARVTDAGIAQLAACKSLTHLYIKYGQISDAVFPHLAALPRLTALTLHGLNVTEKHIGALAKLRSLKVLKISSNNFSDLHMEIVGRLKKLRLFYGYGNLFTKEGVKELQKYLPDTVVKRSSSY